MNFVNDVSLVLFSPLRAGPHRRPLFGRATCLICATSCPASPLLRRDRDAVELPGGRRAPAPSGIVKTANVAPPIESDVAVLRDADELELPHRMQRRDADLVPELEVLVVRRRAVDHHLVRLLAQRPGVRLQRVELRTAE